MTMKSASKPNHLSGEKSPYLIQHVYNPVDWHPWGEAAITKAKLENKPILLSIGYATCHWCHVMEKESFENEAIAALMNLNFVCIKVDREERPDIDTLYMTAATIVNGSGGWPLNVFLTPDLKPFFAGTYFPAEPKNLMISWPDLLQRISGMWGSSQGREKLLSVGEKITEGIQQILSAEGSRSTMGPVLDIQPFRDAIAYFKSVFDNEYGGFSPAPKFPSPVALNFLSIRYGAAKSADEDIEADQALKMMRQTLSAMASGGIHDQLGGGFHRYSTDRQWHIPHFEKMLYDNAQLIVNYVDLYQITGDSQYREIAASTADYVLRDLHHAEGGFYSGEDADSLEPGVGAGSEAKEGAFYAWEFGEMSEIPDPLSRDVFVFHFGVRPEGNAENDPHKEFEGKNILYRANTLKETTERFGLDEDDVKRILEKVRSRLLSVRNQRPRPRLDDKILTAWNGLMISALARLYRATGNDVYKEAAERAASFILENLYDAGENRLYRRWRDRDRKVYGMAEDYAFLIQGLLDLYESGSQKQWLDWALNLMETQIRKFYDNDQGGFFMTEEDHDPHLLFRIKEEHDGVMPSANSISVVNHLRLSHILNREDLIRLARRTVGFFFPKIKKYPGAMPQMLVALYMALSNPVDGIWEEICDSGALR
jgi:uncharacterized protein